MALHTLGQWSTSNNDGLKKDIIAGSLTGQSPKGNLILWHCQMQKNVFLT